MLYEKKVIEIIPVGPLGLIPLKSCTESGDKANAYPVDWRRERESEHKPIIALSGYQRDSYITDAATPRFDTGEGEGLMTESIGGDDLYIMVGICNCGLTYPLFGMTNRMSSDDHLQDLKYVIAAAVGKAHRTSVIMLFLYESRQHRRFGGESLDCALALKELVNMRVENTTIFDAHDPRVQNVIPSWGLETVQPAHQLLKCLLKDETDLQIDSSHVMVIGPDEGGTGRAVYFVSMLGLDIGMFHKRCDYTKTVGGCDPAVARELLGTSMEGKDVPIIDDTTSSDENVMDVVKELKRRKARKVFMCAVFGLSTGGLTRFDEYYDKGIIDRILTTGLIYQTLNLLERPHYINVDMNKYIAFIIDNPNHDVSLNDLLTPTERTSRLLAQHRS